MTRITIVVEYENNNKVPRIGAETKDIGDGRVVAVQFTDALREIEVLRKYCRQCDISAADYELFGA